MRSREVAATRIALGALLLLGCATPPKPRELQAFEELRAHPMAAEAARRAPDLVGTANRFGDRAREEWESDDLPESRRDALLAYIKLKTAIAIAEQQETRARLGQLDNELRAAQQDQAAALRELQQEEDRVAALKKLLRARGENERERVAAEEQKRRQEEQATEQQKKAAGERLAAAEQAMKNAEALDAATHAAADHAAAQALLTRARDDLRQGNWATATEGAEQARSRAEAAARTARPLHEQTIQAKASQERADRMAREAEAIAGATMRRDKRGDVERMVVTIENLFPGAKSKLQPGGEAVLDGVAAWLNRYPSYAVQVVGHTDSKGVPATLTALSLARANAVQTLLVARSVEPSRLTTNGLGADEPIANNRTASGRARNNRIEIVLLYR